MIKWTICSKIELVIAWVAAIVGLIASFKGDQSIQQTCNRIFQSSICYAVLFSTTEEIKHV